MASSARALTAPASSPRSSTTDAMRPRALGLAIALVLGFAAVPAAVVAQTGAARDEAAAISLVAAAKAKAGEFALCASLYQQAYRLDPGYLAYLFSAARCGQKSGDVDGAERDYRAFLSRSPAADPLAEKARGFLDEILAVRRAAMLPDERPRATGAGAAAAVVLPQAATPVTPLAGPSAAAVQGGVVAAARPADGLGWALLAGGAVALGTGGWLAAGGLGDRATLVDDLAHAPNGLIIAESPAQARVRDDAWRTKAGAGISVGVAGVALVAWGAWRLWTGD